ncbi:unnamed protein product [Amoebophrya sp. A25]|nr:unnamed protein product [Amoebophrya sp. A25]|eukprot:GSA25T00016138001.1
MIPESDAESAADEKSSKSQRSSKNDRTDGKHSADDKAAPRSARATSNTSPTTATPTVSCQPFQPDEEDIIDNFLGNTHTQLQAVPEAAKEKPVKKEADDAKAAETTELKLRTEKFSKEQAANTEALKLANEGKKKAAEAGAAKNDAFRSRNEEFAKADAAKKEAFRLKMRQKLSPLLATSHHYRHQIAERKSREGKKNLCNQERRGSRPSTSRNLFGKN